MRPSRTSRAFYIQICVCMNAIAARRHVGDGNSHEPKLRTTRTPQAMDSVCDVLGGPVQRGERMEAA
jgi:hypothetical protein